MQGNIWNSLQCQGMSQLHLPAVITFYVAAFNYTQLSVKHWQPAYNDHRILGVIVQHTKLAGGRLILQHEQLALRVRTEDA